MKIHIVKEGDTLYELSKKYGVTLAKIIDANPQLVDPNQLQVGTKIKVPTEPVSVPGGSQPIIHKHTVKQGDSLWKLSKAWGVTLKDIIDANPQLKNPNALLVGEVVNIPSSGTHEEEGMSMGSGTATGKKKPGSKDYTGVKEEITQPIEQPPVPEPILPKLPEIAPLPEEPKKLEEEFVPKKPEIMPEIKKPEILPEIKKPEIMPEIKKPEIMPEFKKSEFMPEFKKPEFIPQYVMPESVKPEFVKPMPLPHPIKPMFTEPCPPMEMPYHHMMPHPCPEHMNWHGHHGHHGHHMGKAVHPFHHMPQEAVPISYGEPWGQMNAAYPGLTEQPVQMEYSHLAVSESYTGGVGSHYQPYPEHHHTTMTYGYVPSPCGCHGAEASPYYNAPQYGQHMPYSGNLEHMQHPWQSGMGGGSSAYGAYPSMIQPYGSTWSERQSEDPTITASGALAAQESFGHGVAEQESDIPARESASDVSGKSSRAKVHRQQSAKSKASAKKSRQPRVSSNNRHLNPWIKG
ncbi:hypothetical protein JCM10914A_33600 [Paenibacillus sp. JCM 10914]|uniref:LysM peptidoglycan-binding domain-containing protein n=1 Tax=Paenibacillus sp. JCM 10914 TaxID=1236974 RepID=UPI0003CC36F7|nr:LysM domain-containing protein [Paenibacillus sp. JCM 10914]GAE07643.1 NAD(FAD)-utilizing dehydrogenases [Paenibacillus sp. JCM 10914]